MNFSDILSTENRCASVSLRERNDFMLTFGQRLKLIRKEAGLTQLELAEQLMVNVQTVSKWECDTSMPDISQIVPLAAILDVTTDSLLGVGTNEKADREKLIEQINGLGWTYNCQTYENNADYKAYELYKSYIKKYPLDYWGKFHCSQFILSYISNSNGGEKYKIPSNEESELYNEGQRLLQTIISQDKDPQRLIYARSLLVNYHLYKDEYTKAEAVAMEIPDIYDLRRSKVLEINNKKKNYERCLTIAKANMNSFADAYLNCLETWARRISIFGNVRKKEAIDAWLYYEETARLVYKLEKTFSAYRVVILAMCHRSNDYIAISDFENAIAVIEGIRDFAIQHYKWVKENGERMENELGEIKELTQNTLKRSYFLSLGEPNNIIDRDPRFRKCQEDIEALN